jgi:hypothetical protein
MNAMTGGLMLVIGVLIYLVIHSPLSALLFQFLGNTDTITGGTLIQAVIMLLPMIIVLTGVAILVNEAFGNRPPQQYY